MAWRIIARIPWRWWRRLSQIAFLLAFLWLFRQTELRRDEVPDLVDLAFRLDPLIAASAMLAARACIATLLLSLITIGVTLLFGRAFCGWVCPLGTLLDWFGPAARMLRRSPARTRAVRTMRYWILLAVLLGALLGLPLVGYFDPLSLLQQGLTFVIDPALRWVADAGFGWLYFHAPESVTNVSEPVYAFLGDHVLAIEQLTYAGAGVSAGVLLAIFLLERIQRRFWCANLCPLGAGLGLVARLTPFGRKPAKACAKCQQCAHECRMDAFDGERRLEPQACTVCMDCVDACPNQIAQFFWWLPKKRRDRGRSSTSDAAPLELSRRGFIGACAVGAALPAAYATLGASRLGGGSAVVLRPPGALAEKEFLDLCVRCGACMKVCITNGLQPVLLDAGPAGLFSPRLVPRTGHCEYNCLLCAEVCPTGAIELLDLADKQQLKIGLAVFDEDLCLPFAEQEPCIVCEEHCPVPDKAIRLDEVEMIDEEGSAWTLQKPRVENDLCIGCGICENVCPLDDLAGIRVGPAE